MGCGLKIKFYYYYYYYYYYYILAHVRTHACTHAHEPTRTHK